jgi:hypothetical protein
LTDSLSATPQYSSVSDCSNRQQYQRARYCRQFCDVTRSHSRKIVVFDRGFEGWIFRHCTVLLCIRLFEATSKTTISAVAASSVMLPLVTAQTVASAVGSEDAFLRGGTHGRQAQVARRRTQNSARQILRFMVALSVNPCPRPDWWWASWNGCYGMPPALFDDFAR